MNSKNIFTGIITAMLGCTGAAVLLIDAAKTAGASRPELISWVFAVYLLGGIMSITLTLMYKTPLIGAHSISGAAFLGTAAAGFTLPQLSGSFIMAGLFILVIGVTGIFTKFMELLPKTIVSAMLAGLVLNYVGKIVPAVKEMPFVGLLALTGFFIVPKISKKLPPAIGAMAFGLIGLLLWSPIGSLGNISFVAPQMVKPEFSLLGLISIAIPLGILILSNDLAVALAALKQNGFRPPVTLTLVISGLGTALAGLFGGHALAVGGMATALTSSDESGPKKHRYWAALVAGTAFGLFGIFAWFTTGVIQMLPAAFISLVAGFSLLGVFIASIQAAFSKSTYRFSTAFAFVIAASNITFLGISAPIWSLLLGAFAVWVLGEGPSNEVDKKTSKTDSIQTVN